MYYNDNNTESFDCQVDKILRKARVHKGYNKKVIDWLESEGQLEKAENVRECATMFGITNISGIAHVTKANFCRERICSVCAWRRQSKFVAQMSPVMSHLERKGYEFLFVTLTVKNVNYVNLGDCVDLILKGYDRLLHNRKIKESWCGKVRSLEVTFNSDTKTFHPHIHILVAVRKDYFKSEDYISLNELISIWKKSVRAEYSPSVEIQKVTDGEKGAVETLKYAFKPSVDELALKGFFYVLKNRRLVSFSGVFAEVRKLLKFSSIEDVLTDDVGNVNKQQKFSCVLYKFDSTGGVYRFFEKIETEV